VIIAGAIGLLASVVWIYTNRRDYLFTYIAIVFASITILVIIVLTLILVSKILIRAYQARRK
jgi:ABC-type phosphate transport system permease subunit